MFEQLGLIGCGLMGGSFALALKKAGLVKRVVGYSKSPSTTQRAQVVIAGSELCNLFSELNDPLDQLSRFMEQQQMRDAGDEEAMMLDIDFVEMLEYGMPPACGLGYSERVFWIFEGVTAREGVPFPQLRPDIDETTRSIYPGVTL